VVTATGAVFRRVGAQRIDDAGVFVAGRALPPWVGCLRRNAAEVGEQLCDGAIADGGAGDMGVDRVVEGEPAFVTQPHHQDRRERLGDRAETVLRVGVGPRIADSPPRTVPDHAAVSDDRGDKGRSASGRLFGRDTAQQDALGGGQKAVGWHRYLRGRVGARALTIDILRHPDTPNAHSTHAADLGGDDDEAGNAGNA
jgi:hypothetical protein